VFRQLFESDAEFASLFVDKLKTVVTRVSHTGRFDCRSIITKIIQVRLQLDSITKECAKEIETTALSEMKSLPVLTTQPSLYSGIFALSTTAIHKQPTQASLLEHFKNKQRLEICLKSGHNLAAKDVGNTSDPFVDIELYTKEEFEAKGGKYYGRIQSKIIDKTLNPTWDQKWTLTQIHTDELYAIKFEVYDFDTFGANDFMGESIVKREDIEKQSVLENSTIDGIDKKHCSMKLELKDKPGKKEDISGYILVEFSFYDPDAKPEDMDKKSPKETKTTKKVPTVDHTGKGADDDEDFEHVDHSTLEDMDGSLNERFSQAMLKVTLKRTYK